MLPTSGHKNLQDLKYLFFKNQLVTHALSRPMGHKSLNERCRSDLSLQVLIFLVQEYCIARGDSGGVRGEEEGPDTRLFSTGRQNSLEGCCFAF